MAVKCPNINSKEWKDLVKHIGIHNAGMAYLMNGEDIPNINDPVVKALQEPHYKAGPKTEYDLDEKGERVGTSQDVNGNVYKSVTETVSGDTGIYVEKKGDRAKSPGERYADAFWGESDRATKLTNKDGELENYDQAVERINGWVRTGSIKGQVIHKFIQMAVQPHNAERLQKEIEELLVEVEDDDAFRSRWSFIQQRDVLEDIFKNVGINALQDLGAEWEFMRDSMHPEEAVASEDLKMSGVIDMLVEHVDGTFTIVDWKTGNTFNSAATMTNLLLKFGHTNLMDIEDSPRNRAKLQIMFYAFIMKANNPEIRFRDLLVSWIPNRYQATEYDTEQAVETQAYLEMIERMLKDEDALKTLGISKEVYDKLVDKSPSIFDPTHYSSNVTTRKDADTESTVLDDLMTSERRPEEYLNDLIKKLQAIVGSEADFQKLKEEFPERATEALNIQKKITVMMADSDMKIEDGVLQGDIGFITRWMGNYSDISNPIVKTWKQFKDRQEDILLQKHIKKVNRFHQLMLPVLKAYEKANNVIWHPLGKNRDYEKLYGWMYVSESVEGLAYKRERLLHKDEQDPGLKRTYNALDPHKKALLDYVNKEFKDLFVGEKAFMNQMAYSRTTEQGGEIKTSHLGALNEERRGRNQFEHYDGFFFKLPKTAQEYAKEAGGGNKWMGYFAPNNIKNALFRSMTYFTENNYQGGFRTNWASLPVKYMGNHKIDGGKIYTKNMEFIFSEAMYSMLRKEHMDPVLQMGKATKAWLEVKKDSDGRLLFKNTIDFLDDRLMGDIIGQMKRPKWTQRPIRIPMFTPEGFKDEALSVDKIVRTMMNIASMSTMWLKPLQGTGNGMHAMLLTHRDGMKGSLAKIGLTGIKGHNIDFTSKDIARADAVYFKEYIASAMKGGSLIKANKMFLLAKKFNYFGNNFDYAMMQKNLMTKSNKFWDQGTAYMFHSGPEEFVSLTTMAAQMMYMKEKKSGKSIWDLYEVEETEKGSGVFDVVWKGGVRGKEKIGVETGVGGRETAIYRELTGLSSKEIQKLKKVHERLQGGYRKEEAASIEYYMMGKAFIQFKKYFPRLLLNAFHSKRFESELGYYKTLYDPITKEPVLKDGEQVWEWQARATEGRWRTLAHMFVRVLTLGQGAKQYKWSNLSDEQKGNQIEAMLTLVMYAMAYSGYMLLFGHMDDDDTAKKWWKMYLVDNLSQQYNPIDLLHTLKSGMAPVSLAKTYLFVNSFAHMTVASSHYMFGDEDRALTTHGSLKGWATLSKTLPYLAPIVDFNNKWKADKTGIFGYDYMTAGVRYR